MQLEFDITNTILSQAKKAVATHILCTSCLGRLFGKLGCGFSNNQRGLAIYEKMNIKSTDEKCWLCEGLVSEIAKFSDIIIPELEKYEYSTFLIGTKIEQELQVREEELWIATGAEHPEPIKSELNREIGKLIEKKTGKQADFKTPDIVAILDTRYDFVTLQIAPLYFYGRYYKFISGIPQTKWPCRICLGKGCDHCGGKGKLYETSVEELIAIKLMEATKGKDHSFHGMGREDIDARMLGNGRPFILEIKNPRVRTVDIAELECEINKFNEGKVGISHLKYAAAGDVERLKEAAVPKTYVITVKLPEWVDGREKLKKEVDVFGGLQVSQHTPTRVAHRRADIVRRRKIFEFVLEDWNDSDKLVKFKIKAESGTYIKELITGDNDRTKPNIAEVLKTKCIVLGLDVMQIHDDKIDI